MSRAEQTAWVAVLLAVVQVSVSGFFCPHKCVCPRPNVFLCNATTLQTIPTDWPKSLRSLSISHSPLRLLAKNGLKRYGRLEKLKLDYNEIDTIEKYAFRGLVSLKLLSLQHNHKLKVFGKLSFGDIRSKEALELHLRDNGVEEIERNAFSSNANVRKLDLRGNPVKRLKHYALSGLHQVDFVHLPEGIKKIDSDCFFNTSRVHVLQLDGADLNETGLVAHTFHQLSHVGSLLISGSGLGRLHARAFAGIQTVQYIRIIDCHIAHIDRRAFEQMENVGSVELVDNYIVQVDPFFLDPVFNRTRLLFEGNHLHCHCDNMWLLHVKQNTVCRRDDCSLLTDNYCMSPIVLENRALIDIDDNYTSNCSADALFLNSSGDSIEWTHVMAMLIFSFLVTFPFSIHIPMFYSFHASTSI